MAKSCSQIYRLCNTQYNLLIVFTNSQPKQTKRESHSLNVNGQHEYALYRTKNAKSDFNNDKYNKSSENIFKKIGLQPKVYKFYIKTCVLLA